MTEGRDDNDKRPKSDAISDDPAVIGQRFGLGEFVEETSEKVYPKARMNGCFAFIVAAILLPVAILTQLFGSGASVVWWCIGILTAVGAIVFVANPRRYTDRIFWFADGFFRLPKGTDGPDPVALHWRDMASISVRVKRDEEDPYEYHLEYATIEDRWHHTVDFGADLASQAAKKAAAMTRQHFGPLVLPPLIDVVTEGRPVTFGDLTLDGDGILNTRSSTAIAWTSVGLIQVRGQVHIEVKDSSGRYATSFDLNREQNGMFAADVIVHAARQRQVSFRYEQDKW